MKGFTLALDLTGGAVGIIGGLVVTYRGEAVGIILVGLGIILWLSTGVFWNDD